MAVDNPAKSPFTTREQAKAEWNRLYRRAGSVLIPFALDHGVAFGTMWRWLNDQDYEPQDADLRAKLGLPILVSAPGRLCACGCGSAFVPKSSRHRYVSKQHGRRHRYQMAGEVVLIDSQNNKI